MEFTQKGYVRRFEKGNQRSARKQKAESNTPDHDLVIQSQVANPEQELVVLTGSGKVYPVKVGDIPPTSGRAARGTPLVSLLPSAAQGATEAIVTNFLLPNRSTTNLLLLTQQGRMKRLSLSDWDSLTRRGLTVVQLKEDDQLLSAYFIKPNQEVVLATAGGRLLRFEANDEQLPIMGRTAIGLQALRLRKQEQLVGCVTSGTQDNLLLVSRLGYAKRLPVSALRRANRGDIGTQALYFTTKSDALAGMVLAPEDSSVALLTNTQRVVRLPVDSVALMGKDGTGDHILQLNLDEKIVTVTLLPKTEE